MCPTTPSTGTAPAPAPRARPAQVHTTPHNIARPQPATTRRPVHITRTKARLPTATATENSNSNLEQPRSTNHVPRPPHGTPCDPSSPAAHLATAARQQHSAGAALPRTVVPHAHTPRLSRTGRDGAARTVPSPCRHSHRMTEAATQMAPGWQTQTCNPQKPRPPPRGSHSPQGAADRPSASLAQRAARVPWTQPWAPPWRVVPLAQAPWGQPVWTPPWAEPPQQTPRHSSPEHAQRGHH